ncbi:MAG: hypothetical protein PHT62_07705 [Desulfotomaculaceae bacterium]|nr:hypothetical protein [Desulfotomaculaceae bacterium]
MEKINWPEIIEEESDNIIDALAAVYNEACCLNANSEICQVLKIDRDGTVIHHTISANTISSAVWAGNAIELARIAWFNPLDGADEAKVISEYLTKEELQAFTQFLAGEDLTLAKLRQWNIYIADRLEKKCTEKYAADNAPAWAAKAMDKIQKQAEEYGRAETQKVELADLGKS